MIIALFAPEFLLFFAVNERIAAGILLKKVREFHPHLAKPGMLARMHNRIRKDVSTQCQAPATYQLILTEQKQYGRIEQPSQPVFTLVHAFYAIMGGFAFYASYDDNNPTIEESLFQIPTNPRHVEVPEFETLIYIMKHFPHILTDITEEYILDRAESSSLSKALLIVQVAWFCTNCASRLFQGLPLSLFEVSTAAHALCTLLTYFVWWSKPMNIAEPTILREKGAQEVYALLKCSHEEYDEALDLAKKRAAGGSLAPTGRHESAKIVLAANALQHLLPTPERPPLQSAFEEFPTGLRPGAQWTSSPRQLFFAIITMGISPMLYGLVHFLAWSDNFPTPMERLLWCASSIVVTCSGSVYALALWCGCMRGSPNSKLSSNVGIMGLATFGVTSIVYILTSSFLSVESFRQLFFLDAAAYQEDCETVSMASSPPSSFSSHEATMDLPARRHQPLRMRESTTNSSVIPALVSMPSLAGGNVTDDEKRIRFDLSYSSVSMAHTPSSSHVPNVPVATFRYARSQEQELKELKKTSNEPKWKCNQDIQSPSSLQGTISKPRGSSPRKGGDQDNPGEYEW